jgi:hypothetical protein
MLLCRHVRHVVVMLGHRRRGGGVLHVMQVLLLLHRSGLFFYGSLVFMMCMRRVNLCLLRVYGSTP